MTRRTHAFYSFNTGELDPRLIERADVKHYHSALKRAKNLIGLPQGGVTRMFGSWHKYKLRRQLVAVPLSGATFTAPNGGTAANAKDGDSTTSLVTNSVSGSTFVALSIDFGSAVDLAALDLRGIKCAANSGTNVLKVQSSPDNTTWTDFDAARPLSTTSRTFRAALAPRQTRTARYWRVVVVGAGSLSLGAITLEDVFCWTPGSLSAVKFLEININPTSTYVLALTAGNVDVFEGGVWRGAIRIPHTSAQIAAVNYTQSIDTVLLFHEDVAPRKLFRLGTAAIWDSVDAPFVNVPIFDFGDTAYSNGVNEEQIIHSNGAGTSTQFTITVEGYTTGAITASAASATFNANVKAALEALPNIDAGVTVTTEYGADTLNQGLRVKFTGGKNAARPWLEMITEIVQPAGSETLTVQRDVRGQKGGEAIMSASRGYPRHGVFFQQRLVLGGFKSRGNALAYSRTGEFFDFDVNFEGPAAAIIDLLDADDDRSIRRFHVGRHLQIFTSSSAHFMSSRTIDATQPRDYVQSARNGIVVGSHSIDMQGATLYIEQGGEVIREFAFSDVDQDYQVSNLTILSSHLVTGANDLAVRRSSSSSDADIVMVTRSNGDLTLMTALRGEEVNGITWASGESSPYRAIAVDAAGLVHLARERVIGGVTELVLEIGDPDVSVDAAISGVVAGANVTGLADLEGLQVWGYFDGSPYGPFTVSGGAIAHGLDDPPAAALVGTWVPLEGQLLPIRPQDSEAAPRRKMRVHKLWASIFETGNIALGANGSATREVDLWGFSDPIDTPLLDRLVTAEVYRAGILGWSLGGNGVFTQTVPAPFTLRGIRAEFDG